MYIYIYIYIFYYPPQIQEQIKRVDLIVIIFHRDSVAKWL